MPQIANQDYNVGTQNDLVMRDTPELFRLRASLAGAIQRGTIFDFIIKYDASGDVEKNFARPLSVFLNDENRYFVYYLGLQGEIVSIELMYSQEQYNTLAAIVENGAIAQLSIESETDYLQDADGEYICNGGKYIQVTLDDNDYISSYVVTDVEAVGVDVANIPDENLHGLIGLYAGN